MKRNTPLQTTTVTTGAKVKTIADISPLEYEQAIIDAGIPKNTWLSSGYDYFHKIIDRGLHEDSPPLSGDQVRENMEKYDRQQFVKKFGFAIPSVEAMKTIVSYTDKVLEVGAGTGYWCYEMLKAGIEAIATDSRVTHKRYGFSKEWVPIQQMSAIKAIATYPRHDLLICWPSYKDEWAARVLETYSGHLLFYVGENKGGCCADDEFFELLAKDWNEVKCVTIPQWWSIHDAMWIYQRRQCNNG